MENQIDVADVQNYCEHCSDALFVHGTVSSVVEDIINEGLLVRTKDFPTMLSTSAGHLADGTPITEYTWHEPRAQGQDVCLILQIPRGILHDITNRGLKLTQKNIFDVICEDITLTVPDNEETRSAYEECQKPVNNNDKLGSLAFCVLGPKFSQYGAKPGTTYKHVGIPPKYICAITSSNQVYYVNPKVKERILSRKQNVTETKCQTIEQPIYSLYDAEKLF